MDVRHLLIWKSSLEIGKVPMVKTASGEIVKSILTLTRTSSCHCVGMLIMIKPMRLLLTHENEKQGKSRERFLRSALSAHPSSVTLGVINHSPAVRPQWEPDPFVLYPPLTSDVHSTESKSKKGLQRKWSVSAQ